MKRLLSFSICLCLFLVSTFQVNAYTKEDTCVDVVYSFVDAVNSNNVESYISLFSNEIQSEMKTYINSIGKEDFFAESERSIIDIVENTDCILEDECAKYEDAKAFRVRENIVYKDDNDRKTYDLQSGEQVNDYVLVLEDSEWKIYRVSAVNVMMQTASLSEPIETFIYFTKSANQAFYGIGTSGIYFDNYLKDVLPNEWYISRYVNYSNYGYATALASKMYAWYTTEHPKWNYAPYYACMKDNSSDQNYLINSYSNLASNYRTAEASVLSGIDNLAIVKSSNNSVFEIHYHATSGSYHSGTMSASGCWSLAQGGSTYEDILHYYYDKSTYIGSTNTANVVSY